MKERREYLYFSALVVFLCWAYFNCKLYLFYICFYIELKVAIAVIDAAADFFADTKRIIIVSMAHLLVALIVIGLSMGAAGSIYGMNEFKYDPSFGTLGQGRLPILSTEVIVMLAVKTFVLFWVLFFLRDQLVFTTMVAASSYYFDSDATKEGVANVMLGFKWGYGPNFGSVALGSLVQTIISIIRVLLEFSNNDKCKGACCCVFKCVIQCLLGCFDGVVDYVKKLAFAQMAIAGEPYCTSAWNGFMVNLQHSAKFYFTQDVGRFFVSMGALSVAAANTGIFYLLTQTVTYPAGISYIDPLAFVAAASLTIGALILGLFDEAIMATLHCLALDIDVNGGVPKWGPPTFHEKMKAILEEAGADKFADVERMGNVSDIIN
jgi:hypothetical protein